MKQKSPENIYIIGYSKSGNTWLVRLLARTLNLRVERFSKSDKDPEIAADLNDDIDCPNENKAHKLHDLPDEFVADVDKSPKYIIYIYRDSKDVLISSFFYFKYKGDEKYVRLKASFRNILNPWYINRRYISRKILTKFVHLFTTGFIKGGQKNHILKWSSFLSNNKLNSAIVSYEMLKSDTNMALKQIFTDLKLEYDENSLIKAIEKESIENRRKEIKNTSKNELTFGKDFNIKFLLKGTTCDWKNYLTNKQRKTVDKYLI